MNKYIVELKYDNFRIDKFLRKYSKEESLSTIFSFIRKGDVKVNGKKVKENYRLKLNDEISFLDRVKLDFSRDKLQESNEVDISNFKEMIIFEDEDIFIINKKNSIAMYKGDKHSYGLAEMAKKYYNNKDINFSNRLDLDTQGLVIGTKNLNILRKINEAIRNREVKKKYIALVKNNNLRIGDKFYSDKSLEIKENSVIVSKNGMEARTNFEVIDIIDNKVLLDIDLITGRKHQIRVHLADLLMPIIGDKKYGKADKKLYLKCYSISFLDYNFSIDKKFD